MAELVSVVIPMFNRAAYVMHAVKSILSQTYHDLEIIVVDDGSTDDSAAQIQSLSDHRLQVVQQENRGPSAALNTGLRLSTGAYVAILGSDDVADPHRIELQVAALERGALDSIFCKPRIIDCNGAPLPSDRYPDFLRAPTGCDAAQHLRKLFVNGNYFCAPSQCMRRDVVDQVGYFHEGLVQLQDFEYVLRMVGIGMRLQVLDDPLVSYRCHGENLSGSNRTVAVMRELLAVYRGFADGARPNIIRTAFDDVLDPGTNPDQPLTLDELGLIFLSHPRPAVRQVGIEHLIEARKSQQQLSQQGRDLISFREFFTLLNEPD
jgi:glycosyltransferase involved in cell wall biosynthesis